MADTEFMRSFRRPELRRCCLVCGRTIPFAELCDGCEEEMLAKHKRLVSGTEDDENEDLSPVFVGLPALWMVLGYFVWVVGGL